MGFFESVVPGSGKNAVTSRSLPKGASRSRHPESAVFPADFNNGIITSFTRESEVLSEVVLIRVSFILGRMKLLRTFAAALLIGALLFPVMPGPVRAQDPPRFALQDGDRVVLAGDGLIEHAQHFGYIEAALSVQRPGLAFRNVGWSGDTVSGEARDHYTHPPTGFEHLVEQLTAPQPTVAVLAYGGTLAFENDDALSEAVDGYHTLLDTLATRDIRCVLVSPIPHDEHASPHPDVAALNEQLATVRDAFREVAAVRECGWVDLFDAMAGEYEQAAQQGGSLTGNGVRLNEAGYRVLARRLIQAMEPLPPDLSADLALDLDTGEITGGTPYGSGEQETGAYVIIPNRLPYPGEARNMIITGLSRGTYRLTAGEQTLAVGTARAWQEGIAVYYPAEIEQLAALRRAIVEKNRLYFRQYRPQNETYLVGFRQYEQGQNAPELTELDPIIHEKENEIGRLCMGRPLVFTLTRE